MPMAAKTLCVARPRRLPPPRPFPRPCAGAGAVAAASCCSCLALPTPRVVAASTSNGTQKSPRHTHSRMRSTLLSSFVSPTGKLKKLVMRPPPLELALKHTAPSSCYGCQLDCSEAVLRDSESAGVGSGRDWAAGECDGAQCQRAGPPCGGERARQRNRWGVPLILLRDAPRAPWPQGLSTAGNR